MRQIQDLQGLLTPTADSKASEPVTMDIDTIIEYEGDKEEEDSKESATEEHESLFFNKLDHKEVRTNGDQSAQEYWGAGITTESLSTLKAGNVEHSQKLCYHCSRKGHKKADCPSEGNQAPNHG